MKIYLTVEYSLLGRTTDLCCSSRKSVLGSALPVNQFGQSFPLNCISPESDSSLKALTTVSRSLLHLNCLCSFLVFYAE